ncbi:MAG: fibronectin type III domain-containing protein [Candidatus Peribacteraceae bacterium]|nr:fibronectin type III domain-containing protein [Candidatus Peribacteraceae bacterium]
MTSQHSMHRHLLALALLAAAMTGTGAYAVRGLHGAAADVLTGTGSSSTMFSSVSSLADDAAAAAASSAASLPAPASSASSAAKKQAKEAFLSVRPHCAGLENNTEDQKKCSAFLVTSPLTLQTNPLPVGDILSLDIVVQNTPKAAVQKVRSWLQYDPDILEGMSITPSSLFPLATPGESAFDPERGYAMIQLETATPDMNKNAIVPVVHVQFRVLRSPPGSKSVIAFYDTSGSSPHAAVYSAAGNNILSPKLGTLSVVVEPSVKPAEGSSSSVSVPASSASSAADENDASSSDASVASVPPVQSSSAASGETAPAVSSSSSLASSEASSAPSETPHGAADDGAASSGGRSAFVVLQVQNVRATTDGTSLFIAWDTLSSPALQGYNVYYGTETGRYVQRRTVRADETSASVRSLPEGVTYYIAIRGLNDANEETSFSREVAVTIGDPRSATSPLYLRPEDKGPQGQNPVKTIGDGSVPGASGLPSTAVLLLVVSAVIGTLMAVRRQFVASLPRT